MDIYLDFHCYLYRNNCILSEYNTALKLFNLIHYYRLF